MNDFNSIWNSFSNFYSSIITQKYLLKNYKRMGFLDAEKKSYENCYPFIYYLDHGKSFYQLAIQAPFSIKPILLFYGMIQLLKACLLTVDPYYPESTSVLAHGVTTRKKKKKNYDFLKDEVKIQKNGLFSYIAIKMFHMKQDLDFEKYTMEFLLARVPELNNLFKISFEKQQNYKIAAVHEQILTIPSSILDHLNMTKPRFLNFLKQSLPFDYQVIENKQIKQADYIQLQLHNTSTLNLNTCTPIQYNNFDQTLHIPIQREQFLYFPEIMTHYLLLYNLSMISRYETEWWGELLNGYDSLDYPFINNFLNFTITKIPFLIQHYLLEK